MIKKLLSFVTFLMLATGASAQGWPANYGGVMLQGFYWDSYDDTQWTKFTEQAGNWGIVIRCKCMETASLKG